MSWNKVLNEQDRRHSCRWKKGANISFWVIKGRLRMEGGSITVKKSPKKLIHFGKVVSGWGRDSMVMKNPTWSLRKFVLEEYERESCLGPPKSQTKGLRLFHQIYGEETKVLRKWTMDETGVLFRPSLTHPKNIRWLQMPDAWSPGDRWIIRVHNGPWSPETSLAMKKAT